MSGLLAGLFYSRRSARPRFERSLVLKRLSPPLDDMRLRLIGAMILPLGLSAQQADLTAIELLSVPSKSVHHSEIESVHRSCALMLIVDMFKNVVSVRKKG